METHKYDLIVIGGGAAGIFCAIQFLALCPERSVLILEKSNKLLAKLKVSGGGRCNVTHACFDPKEMVLNYPRGSRELLGPFHKFLCGDMMAWLAENGVETKIESDGRVFPVSDSSQSIMDCFLNKLRAMGGDIRKRTAVARLEQVNKRWELSDGNDMFLAERVFMATGSSKGSWVLLKKLGHTIVAPVPSLFTFNIPSSWFGELPGLSVPDAIISIPTLNTSTQGPLLITHWGLSGPAVLKLSALAARELFALNYSFKVEVNWLGMSRIDLEDVIRLKKASGGKKKLVSDPLVSLPKRLWKAMCGTLKIGELNYHDLSKIEIESLIDLLLSTRLEVNGKSTFKEEFVTAGGIETSEVDFRSMESKLCSGLYFGGEVLNIDAITGGYNFQACWTEAHIAAEAIARLFNKAPGSA